MLKLYKWYSEHILGILVLLIIIVIGLYIIHYAESITDKAKNIITAIAAAISTFFLFLSFRESKKSNQLKILDLEYRRLEKLVAEQEKLADQKIFNNSEIKAMIDDLNCPKEFVSSPTYKLIGYYFVKIFDLITANAHYQQIIQLLDKNDVAVLPSNNASLLHNAPKISEALEIIADKMNEIRDKYQNQCFLYNSVYSSELYSKQKELLIIRLDKCNVAYSDIGGSSASSYLLDNYLKSTIFFTIQDEITINIKPLLFSTFNDLFNLVNSIKCKYPEY